jgi:hypothetical protein
MLNVKIMKYAVFFIFLLVFYSCSERGPSENDVTESFESPLTFSADMEGWNPDEKKSFNDFTQLFINEKSIGIDNISVNNQQDEIYSFSQNLGDLVISEESDNSYAFLERYIIPVGNVYAKFALLRYIVDVKEGTVHRDEKFIPQLGIYKYWSNHIVKEYDSYLSNPDFSNKDISSVPHEAFDVMRFLMFNLTLAVIMEDCEPCRERMAKITENFPFVEKKDYSQNLLVCKTILRKFND